MTLRENIRTLRKQKKWTQRQLADRLHVDCSSVTKWETGNATPDSGKQQILADLFGVSVDFLLGRTTNPYLTAAEGGSVRDGYLTAAEPGSAHKGYLVGYPDPPMTAEEQEHLRKYHVIPTDGKKRVDNVLDFEYNAFQNSSPEEEDK